MRGVYGLSLILASGMSVGLVACAEAQTATLQSNYDESKSVAATVKPAAVSGTTHAAVPTQQVVVTAFDKSAAAALVENHFSGINTLRAQFTQTTTGEAFSQEGVFYLKKPRQFLWRYETPIRQKVIGTGTAIYYHDEETNQVTQLPSNSGLTKLFTVGRLDLAREGISVEQAQDTPLERTVWLSLNQKKGMLGAGEMNKMKLVFSKSPEAIKVIEATDLTGAVTKITLNDVVKNGAVDAKLFKFSPQTQDR